MHQTVKGSGESYNKDFSFLCLFQFSPTSFTMEFLNFFLVIGFWFLALLSFFFFFLHNSYTNHEIFLMEEIFKAQQSTNEGNTWGRGFAHGLTRHPPSVSGAVTGFSFSFYPWPNPMCIYWAPNSVFYESKSTYPRDRLKKININLNNQSPRGNSNLSLIWIKENPQSASLFSVVYLTSKKFKSDFKFSHFGLCT